MCVLVVDEDDRLLRAWRVMLDSGAADAPVVVGITDGEGALTLAGDRSVDVVVVDLHAGSVSGLDLLDRLRASLPTVEVVLTGAQLSPAEVVRAVRAGAFDVLAKPFVELELCIERVRAALAHKRLADENRLRGARAAGGQVASAWFSLNPAAARRLGQLDRAARSEAHLLLAGPAGVGKSTLALAAHQRSTRASRPPVMCEAVNLNAANLPDQLSQAAGSTLVIEDVDQLSASGQRCLRAHLNLPVQRRARIIATTRESLEARSAAGEFDLILAQRLGEVALSIPTLATRLEDLPHLAHRFLAEAAEAEGRPVPPLSTDCLALLRGRTWREDNLHGLRRALAHAARVAGPDGVTVDDLPDDLRAPPVDSRLTAADLVNLNQPWKDAIASAENLIRATYLRGLLDRSEGNMTRAAEAAGLDRSNFRRHVKRYLRGTHDDVDDEEASVDAG